MKHPNLICFERPHKYLWLLLFSLLNFTSTKFYSQNGYNLDSLVKVVLKKEQKTNQDLDFLYSSIHDYYANIPPTEEIFNALKRDKRWVSEKWENVRILDTAFFHYYLGEKEKAFEFFDKHTSLADQSNQIMSMSQSLGLVRSCFGKRQREKLTYYEKKLAYYEEYGPEENMAVCFHGIGNAYYAMANYSLAIRNYLKASEIYKGYQAAHYGNELAVVGTIYYDWGNKSKAIEYLEKSIPILNQEKYYETECYALNTLIKIYREQKEYDKAMAALQKVFKVYENYSSNKEINENKIVSLQEKIFLFLDLKKTDEAYRLLSYVQVLGDSLNIDINSTQGFFENDFGYYRYYKQKEDWDKAELALLKALSLANQNGLSALEKKYIKEAAFFYNMNGDKEKSNQFAIEFIELSDSMSSTYSENLLATYEFEKLDRDKALQLNQIENKRKQNRLVLSSISGILGILAIGLLMRIQRARKTQKIIEYEKQQSDKLLLNILPKEIADELKSTGNVKPELVENATVLFTDFIGFTKHSEVLDSAELVEELNICFSEFDNIIKRNNIEKIKTIGDAYMAVGGLQGNYKESAKNAVMAALEMQSFINERQRIHEKDDKELFEMRVGLHTGSVTAGVVGKDKFQFDIWGDTVNIASRMESHGEANKVNVSKNTFTIIEDFKDFEFQLRDSIRVKGKGEMKMYFVNKIKM